MKLNLGENIRKHRRRLDLTQDELAERLGVSFQTVSRWENGTTYPDMELLPEIADLFSVTVDALMGVDRVTEERKVKVYLDRFQKAVGYGRIDECIGIAREGIAEFPNNYALLGKLMYALFLEGDSDGSNPDWKEASERNDAEIVSLGERIVKYCADGDIRNEAKRLLAFNHCEMGRKAEGRAIYETLPLFEHCRELNIGWALEDKEELKKNELWYLTTGFELVYSGLWQCCDRRPIEEQTAFLDAMEQIEDLRHGGKRRIGSEHYGEFQFAVRRASVAAKLGREEEMFAALRRAVEEASAFDAWQEDETMIFPFEGERTNSRADYETDNESGARQRLRERELTSAEFDPYRDSEQFRAILASLA
ncbi:MAG: helix-turn-helix transcriptional regulator [Clostridia bacterium]|nr:helix-turn-helix transcriptional regulator [Clostridia bacterium]